MEPTRPIMIPFEQSIFREITDDAVDQRMLLEQMHYRQQYELARKQEFEKMILLQSTAFRPATEPTLAFIQQPQRPPLGPENFLLGNGSPFTEKAALLAKQEGLEADFERRLSSSRVKLKLKECLLTRRQQQGGNTTSPPQAQPVPQWTSIDSQASPPQACMLSYPLSGNNLKGFPIRKTSSEPNLKVKSALKQKVIDRRSSPLLKRQQHKAFVCNNSGGSQGNSLNSPVSSGNEEPSIALESALSSLGSYAAQAGGFALPPDDLTSHTSLPNLNNCRVAQNSSSTAASEGDSGSLDLTTTDASGENLPKEATGGGTRRPTMHCLNRASSSPLLIRDAATAAVCATNSLQIAVQEQKMLVKKHLRQKVLTKNLLTESEKSSSPVVPQAPGAANRPGANFRACLERTASSPIMKLPSPIKEERSHEFSFSTALVYDPAMLSHQCLCGTEENHPENPARLAAIWQRMQDSKLVSRCDKVRGRKASLHELQHCHSETFTVLYGTSAINRDKINPRLLSSVKFCRLPCQGVGIDSDTVWNETHTASAARIAAGCVLALAARVAQREVPNGFALVRPPGHHAEVQQAMGFCYFNSVAVAARSLLRSNPEIKRILIIDWDVHHGNGTQQIFYNDPSVLYISLHRYEQGRFFPGTGAIKEVGEEAGLGFNVNIAWSGTDLEPSKMGDAEYMAAFRCIVIPLARQFAPDLILVSAGFDGTAGHPHALGGYELSPAIFAWMTEQLMKFADGKVVLSLEGGYDVPSLCDSVEACVKTLMNEEDRPQVANDEVRRQPNGTAVRCLKAVLKEHRKYWPCLERVDVREAECSHYAWEHPEESTVAAMAELSVEPESMEVGTS